MAVSQIRSFAGGPDSLRVALTCSTAVWSPALLFTTTFGSLTREYSSLPSVRRRFDFPRADEGGIILGMSENCRTQKQYDHRLRLLIQNTRDLDLAVRHESLVLDINCPTPHLAGKPRPHQTEFVSFANRCRRPKCC